MSSTKEGAAAATPTGSKLRGRVAFVTGGSRGIGAAITRSLAAQGATVAIGYSSNKDKAEEVRASLNGAEEDCSLHQGNVGSAEDCRRTIGEVIDTHERLDILVNNAGITSDKGILKMEEDQWYKVLAVNLSGAFFMSQAALGHMLDRGSGRIVNISSIIGQIGNIGQANYAASKSGLFGLTMTMAREAAAQLAKRDDYNPDDPENVGLTVNAVAP
ncbi:MAG TPA: SDR family NAD(P)-dependent oxidoreductase, partial [Solirubrobacteraceae bacterium]